MNAALTLTTKKPIAPTNYDCCYACDASAVGVTERWTDDKRTLVYACKRHSDPMIKMVHACQYCGDEVRAGSISYGDGTHAHRKCHAADSKANN